MSPPLSALPHRLEAHVHQALQVLEACRTPALLQALEQAAQIMAESLCSGGKILACGNGGSMCEAQHFAEELTGRYRADRPALAALALGDAGHITCVGNDYGFEHIFARGVEALGRPGDVLLALSTSGNSPNVVRAAEAARQLGLQVVGLTANSGGRLAGLCNIELRVPHTGPADRAQEVHLLWVHALIDGIEHRLGYAP